MLESFEIREVSAADTQRNNHKLVELQSSIRIICHIYIYRKLENTIGTMIEVLEKEE